MELIQSEFIPTSTISCHAAATVYFKGERLTAWFGGDVEGCSNVDIYLQKNDLSAYPLNVNFNNMPAWNPVFVPVAKRLFLFFKVGKFCDSWQTFYMEYKDGKLDRPGMKLIPAGLNGPVKTAPVVSDKGNTVTFGSSVETWYNWTSYIEVFNFKGGEFLFQEMSNPITSPDDPRGGVIQPSLISDDKGTVHGFFRSKLSGKVWYGSDKNGFSTIKPFCDGPNSSVSAVYHEGHAYMACNTNPGVRLPLSIHRMELTKGLPVIKDTLEIEGEVEHLQFEVIEKLVDYPSGTYTRVISTTMEASYPYMIVNPDGNLEVVYTYGRRALKRAIVKI